MRQKMQVSIRRAARLSSVVVGFVLALSGATAQQEERLLWIHAGGFPQGISSDGRTIGGPIVDNNLNRTGNSFVWREGSASRLLGGVLTIHDVSPDGNYLVGWTSQGLPRLHDYNTNQVFSDIFDLGGYPNGLLRGVSSEAKIVVGGVYNSSTSKASLWKKTPSGSYQQFLISSNIETYSIHQLFDVSSDGSLAIVRIMDPLGVTVRAGVLPINPFTGEPDRGNVSIIAPAPGRDRIFFDTISSNGRFIGGTEFLTSNPAGTARACLYEYDPSTRSITRTELPLPERYTVLGQETGGAPWWSVRHGVSDNGDVTGMTIYTAPVVVNSTVPCCGSGILPPNSMSSLTLALNTPICWVVGPISNRRRLSHPMGVT